MYVRRRQPRMQFPTRSRRARRKEVEQVNYRRAAPAARADLRMQIASAVIHPHATVK